MADRPFSTTAGAAFRAAGLVKRYRVVLAALLGAVVFQLAFVASFNGADARPVLHHVTIGVVGPVPAATGRAHGTVSYQRFPTYSSARQAVSTGRLPAAMVVGGSHRTLLVADAAGLTLSLAIEEVATAQAAAAHAILAVDDVRPLPAGDPRGFGTFLLVLGWIIGGYLGMALLSRVLAARARGLRGVVVLTAWTAAYALVSGGLGVVLVGPLMGTLVGHPWALLGAGTLIVFAAAMATAALMSLLGTAGILVAVVGFIVLGNPTSGGPVPVQMLSGGFGFLAQVLPNYAGVALVRGIQYLGGDQLGHPLLVLALYAVVATAVCFAQAWRRSRSAAADLATAPNLRPVAP